MVLTKIREDVEAEAVLQYNEKHTFHKRRNSLIFKRNKNAFCQRLDSRKYHWGKSIFHTIY